MYNLTTCKKTRWNSYWTVRRQTNSRPVNLRTGQLADSELKKLATDISASWLIRECEIILVANEKVYLPRRFEIDFSRSTTFMTVLGDVTVQENIRRTPSWGGHDVILRLRSGLRQLTDSDSDRCSERDRGWSTGSPLGFLLRRWCWRWALKMQYWN